MSSFYFFHLAIHNQTGSKTTKASPIHSKQLLPSPPPRKHIFKVPNQHHSLSLSLTSLLHTTHLLIPSSRLQAQQNQKPQQWFPQCPATSSLSPVRQVSVSVSSRTDHQASASAPSSRALQVSASAQSRRATCLPMRLTALGTTCATFKPLICKAAPDCVGDGPESGTATEQDG
jgi:hypothetical protein